MLFIKKFFENIITYVYIDFYTKEKFTKNGFENLSFKQKYKLYSFVSKNKSYFGRFISTIFKR